MHIEPQGAVHAATPDTGSGTSGRPMLIINTSPTHQPLGNMPWPAPSPPITPGDVWDPPSPFSQGVGDSPLIPGPIMKRWS